jgi:tetratricopeptide (TPR) repeat protein
MSDKSDATLEEQLAAERRARQVFQVAFAVVLVLLVGGGGAYFWWQGRKIATARTELQRVTAETEAVRAEVEGRRATEQARQMQRFLTIGEQLERFEEALRTNDAAAAASRLAEMERLAAGGGAGPADIARCRAELDLLRELDEIDTLRWTATDGRPPDPAALAARLAAALNRFGINPEVSAEDAALRAAQAVIRDRLLAALEFWYVWTRSPTVLATLREVDSDPYRAAVRNAVRANDGERLAELVARPELADQPPSFVAVIAECRVLPASRREAVLRGALRRNPDDFALLMALGSLLAEGQTDRTTERVGWYRAAVALRPSSATALNHLGLVLLRMGDLDGALAAFREAIRLDPASAASYAALGAVLRARGESDAAIAAFQEAARLDPEKYAPLLKGPPAVAPPPRPAKP